MAFHHIANQGRARDRRTITVMQRDEAVASGLGIHGNGIDLRSEQRENVPLSHRETSYATNVVL